MAEKDLLENPFRDEIYDYLLAHGYVAGQRADYDYKNALDVGKLFAFLESTQAEELTRFKETYGARYRERYVELLCRKIENRGLLTALNEWVEDYASGTKFSLAFFKSGLNAMSEGLELYEKNVFSIRKEFVFEDKAAARQTLDRVREFVKDNPTVYLSTHCPEGYENLEMKRIMKL